MVDKKIILGAIVLVIVIVAAVGGYYIYQSMSVPPTTTQTTQITQIKVGVLLPLTGGAAHEGWLARHAIELAIDDINSNGGVKSLGGAQLVPIFADTGASQIPA